MFAAAVESGIALLATYGTVLLPAAFVLEGALVGKVIPTRTLFLATAIAVGESAFELAALVAAVAVGATVGQLVLFVLVRRTGVSPASLPGATEPPDESRVLGWLDRWGTAAIALSNVLPVVRGSLTIPAAMADATALRFSASSMAGSALYAIGLAVMAAEAGTAIRGVYV